MNELDGRILQLLNCGEPREIVMEKILREALPHFHSETGTIHLLDSENRLLYLSAQIGLPPQMLEVVKTIPVGKGIAGQVILQNKPVTICNLQADSSGVVKPGAKQTGCATARKPLAQSESAQCASTNTRRKKRANWKKSAG